MTSADWYYATKGTRWGPVSQAELEQMIRSGEVTKDAFVWSAGMDGWKRVADVEVFAPLFVIFDKKEVTPPPLPPEALPNLPEEDVDDTDADKRLEVQGPPEFWQVPVEDAQEEADEDYVAPPRQKPFDESERIPWRRYFARLIDISIVVPITLAASIVIALYLNTTYGVAMVGAPLYIMIGLSFVMMAFMLAVISWTFGNTPGKAIFAIHVRSEFDDAPLSFFGTFFRELKVYFLGLAFGIGPLAIIPQLFAFKALSSGKRVFYDRDEEDTRVLSYSDSSARMVAAGIATVVAIVAILATSMAINAMDNSLRRLTVAQQRNIQNTTELSSASSQSNPTPFQMQRDRSDRNWLNPITSRTVSLPERWAVEDSSGGELVRFVNTSTSASVDVWRQVHSDSPDTLMRNFTDHENVRLGSWSRTAIPDVWRATGNFVSSGNPVAIQVGVRDGHAWTLIWTASGTHGAGIDVDNPTLARSVLASAGF